MADEQDWELWHDFLRAHHTVLGELEQELRRRHQLTATQYGVLRLLFHADGGRVRMQELADAVGYSSGAATRMVDPLVRAGLVERESDPDDRRLVIVTLTRTGRDLYLKARPDHIEGIERLFLGRMTPDERAVMAAALKRLAGSDSRVIV